MSKTTSITLSDEVFDLVDDIRGSIPRSTFVSDMVCEHLTDFELENDSEELERVYIDFDKKTTLEFNKLLKFYERYSMHGITQAKFFEKIFEMGTRSMRIFMDNKKEKEIITCKDEL